MQTKRLILVLIIAIVAFGLFMGYALKKIQTVDRSYIYLDQPLTDELLLDVTKTLSRTKEETLVGDVAISAIKVVLINHLSETAVLWHGEVKAVVDYASLGDAERHCNYYSVYSEDEPTLIINCDLILGDPFERVVALAYQQRYADISRLNPESFTYFQGYDEDVRERYSRYQMITTLMDSLDGSNSLEAFGYYYREWVDVVGESHLAMTEYDYYDGLEAFIKLKLRQLDDPSYTAQDYIVTLQNDQGLISKSREYEAIGLLWWVLAEQKGLNVLELDDVRTDKYKLLLDGVAYTPIDDTEAYESFIITYESYNREIEGLINQIKSYTADLQARPRTLLSEIYKDTILVSDNHYLYLDYLAREDGKTMIKEEMVLVEMAPYSIKYYQ